MLVISPWLVRNAQRLHHFVFIRSTSWEVFWRGNNPAATGHSCIDADHTVLNALPPAQLEELKKLPGELAQGEWFRKKAFSFIREHPRDFIWLTAKKFSISGGSHHNRVFAIPECGFGAILFFMFFQPSWL